MHLNFPVETDLQCHNTVQHRKKSTIDNVQKCHNTGGHHDRDIRRVDRKKLEM